jgi:hypothetical protein
MPVDHVENNRAPRPPEIPDAFTAGSNLQLELTRASRASYPPGSPEIHA